MNARDTIRMLAPACFFAAMGSGFLILYARMLGESPAAFWHHLAILVPVVVLLYALVGCTALIRVPRLRRTLAWLVCLLFISAQFLFYAVAAVCLYGFRDLPTRHVITGYMDQIVPMMAVLPVSTGLLLLAALLLLLLLSLLAVVMTWLMLPAIERTVRTGGPMSRWSWPRLAALSTVGLVLLLSNPWDTFSEAREPLVSSIHDKPLSSSNLQAQLNPVEAARDRKVEAEYPSKPIGNRRNVILIYVDALRADVLQSYGGMGEMPFISKLVLTGQLRQFQNVYASCSQTICGMGAILQSRPAHRVAVGNFSLPKLLKRQGYDLRYLLSADHQSFLGLKAYYGPGIDFYADGKDMDPLHSTDDFLVVRNLDKLPTSTETVAPQFIMLGLMSVHVWGARHEEYRQRKPDQLNARNILDTKSASMEAYRNNYLNGVRQLDEVLREIWGWLERSGYLNDSVVVITSDHGEALGEGGIVGHARSLSTSELHIPLWIHAPHGDWPASPFAFQTDLAPTILDILDLPVPETWEGQSLRRERNRSTRLPLYFQNRSDMFGVIYAAEETLYKYVYNRADHTAAVHDLLADAEESSNLAPKQGAANLAALKAGLEREFGPLLLN